MTELFQSPSPEDPLEKQRMLETRIAASLQNIFYMIEDMGQRIEAAPNPRPGIQRWYKTDLFENTVVEGSDGTGLLASTFQAELHEQDSGHVIWQFKFSSEASDGKPSSVYGLSIKSREVYRLLLSEITQGIQEPPLSTYVAATDEQIDQYEETVIYPNFSAIRDFDTGYNLFDEPDGSDYKHEIEILKESKITIPGIARDGQLLK